MEDGEAGKASSRSGEQQGRLPKPSWRRAVGGRSHADRGSPPCMYLPHPQHTHILSHCPLLVPQLLFDVRALTECKKFDISMNGTAKMLEQESDMCNTIRVLIPMLAFLTLLSTKHRAFIAVFLC